MIKDLEKLKDRISTNEQVTRENIATALAYISKAGVDKESEVRELLEGVLLQPEIEKIVSDLDSYDI